MSSCKTVSVIEAARQLGISRAVGYRLAREGILPVLRLGKRLVVPKAALARLLSDPQSFNRGKPEVAA